MFYTYQTRYSISRCLWAWLMSFIFLLTLPAGMAATEVEAASSSSEPEYSIASLVKSGDLDIRAWVGKEGATDDTIYSVNQQVVVYIDIGTSRWFTGGAQINRIDVPNLIALQRSTSATNYTERRDGVTWSRQRWELTLYPQSSGQFDLGRLQVQVKVSAPNGKSVQGTLVTPALSLKAALPSEQLTKHGAWMAASQVTLTQEWQTSAEEVQAGDSITRIVNIDAVDSLSILLPPLMTATHNDMLQSYLAPPELVDKQNRGEYQSSRRETMTYIVQQGGQVELPELTLWWWNTQTNQLEQLHLDGQSFTVHHTWRSWLQVYWQWLVLATLVLLLVSASVIGVKRYYRAHPLPLSWQFSLALRHKDWPTARRLLYVKLRRFTAKLSLQQYFKTELAQAESMFSESASTFHYRFLWRKILTVKQSYASWRKPLQIERKLKLSDK